MKGNIKKLAVFVIIAEVAMFTAVAIAWDNDHHDHHCQNAIWGQYALEAAATCMIAPLGFNADLTPINGVGIISTQYRQGTFTFNKDGTGSATANASGIGLPFTGPNGPVPPAPYAATIELDFTYTLDDDGMIIVTQVPGTYFVTYTSGPNNGKKYQVEGVSFKATITPDGKNMTTYTDASELFTVSGPGIPPNISPNESCGGAGVLIWQHNYKP